MKKVKVTGKPAKRIKITGKPQRKISPEKFAKAIGAEPCDNPVKALFERKKSWFLLS